MTNALAALDRCANQAPAWLRPQTGDEAPDFGPEPGSGKRLPKDGKRDYALMQRQKEPLADGLDAIGKTEHAAAVRECGRLFKVHNYQFGKIFECCAECKHPVCPSAQWARSRRLSVQVAAASESYCTEHPGTKPILLTITVRNCSSVALKDVLDLLIRGFARLMNRAAMKRAFPAWVRSIEITYNHVFREWHPHIHAVVLAVPGYFRRKNGKYITVDEMREELRKALRLEYDPIIDMQAMYGQFAPLDARGRKSLREVTKYTLKPGDFISGGRRPTLPGADEEELYDAGDGQGLRYMTQVPLRALVDALHGRRLFQMSASLKKVEVLDFADDPDAELKAQARELGEFICTELYAWCRWGDDADYFRIGILFDPPKGESVSWNSDTS